jgi:ATP-dependent DNA helicase RecQ
VSLHPISLVQKLRPFQEEAIRLLQEKSVHLLCIAPTGSGKSLIYEAISREKGRKTLLISPLIALARQQAERLTSQGQSVTLYPGASPKPLPHAGSGVWIISPESLQSPRMLQQIRLWKPDFLAVDECHCLYDWGDLFRTAFLEIPQLVQTLDIQRTVWLTATLPQAAKLDLESRIAKPLQVVGRFELAPNLHLAVRHIPWIYRAQILLEEVTRRKNAGIIFVNTRSATFKVQNLIQQTGRCALVYHAGLSHEERCSIEENFKRSPDAILIATSAFGMGMDYANLKWTVLWQPPSSLLGLAQSLGRVGRNRNRPAFATVFWDEEDFRNLEWMTRGSARRGEELHALQNFLKTYRCRDQGLSAYFNYPNCEDSVTHCGRCDFCLGTEIDYITIS